MLIEWGCETGAYCSIQLVLVTSSIFGLCSTKFSHSSSLPTALSKLEPWDYRTEVGSNTDNHWKDLLCEDRVSHPYCLAHMIPPAEASGFSHRFTQDSIMSLDISLSRVSRCFPNSSSGQWRSRMKVCKASSFQKRSSDVLDPLLPRRGRERLL